MAQMAQMAQMGQFFMSQMRNPAAGSVRPDLGLTFTSSRPPMDVGAAAAAASSTGQTPFSSGMQGAALMPTMDSAAAGSAPAGAVATSTELSPLPAAPQTRPEAPGSSMPMQNFMMPNWPFGPMPGFPSAATLEAPGAPAITDSAPTVAAEGRGRGNRRTKGGGKGRGRGGGAEGGVAGQGGQGTGVGSHVGNPKFISFCKGVSENALSMLQNWSTSSMLDTTKKFRSPYGTLAAECRWRAEWLNDPERGLHLIDTSVKALADELLRYEQVLPKVEQIQQEWGEFEVYTKSGVTLSNLHNIFTDLEKNQDLKTVWRNGHWVPAWQRQKYLMLQLSFRIGDATLPLEVPSLLLMVNPEASRNLCPSHSVQLLPVGYPEYLPIQQRKEEMLRGYWATVDAQNRCYSHLIVEALKHPDHKCQNSLRKFVARLFAPSFPALKELLDDEDKEESQAKRARSEDEPCSLAGEQDDAEDSDDAMALFADAQVDLHAFDSSSASSESQFLSVATKADAANIVSLLWPSHSAFRMDLGRATKAYLAKDHQPLMRAMTTAPIFKKLAESAIEFKAQVDGFQLFYDSFAKSTWPVFQEFAVELEGTYASCFESDGRHKEHSVIAFILTKWYLQWAPSKGLKILKQIDSAFASMRTNGYNVEVQGEYEANIAKCEMTFLKSLGMIFMISKSLLCAGLHSALPKKQELITATKASALSTLQWLEDMSFIGSFTLSHEEMAEIDEGHSMKHVLLSQWIGDCKDLLADVADAMLLHMVNFVDVAKDTKDLQNQYEDATVITTKVMKSFEPSGAFAKMSRQGAEWWPININVADGNAFLSDNDVRILKLVAEQQSVLPHHQIMNSVLIMCLLGSVRFVVSDVVYDAIVYGIRTGQLLVLIVADRRPPPSGSRVGKSTKPNL